MRSEGGGQLRMTQSELAAHLGTTREVIAKLLRKMVADKSVKTLRGSIVVERPEVLARLAGQE
jgi:CRP/FNR family transcriptional regulator